VIVETEVEGRPGQVREAAAWLRDSYQAKVMQASRFAQGARAVVGHQWSGEAADSYREVIGFIVASCGEEAYRMSRAAELLDDLAEVMEAREKAMQSIRDRADGAGLTVRGTRIYHVDRTDIGLPQTAAERTAAAHEAALEGLLAQLGRDVEEVNDRFREWVKGDLSAAVDAQRRRAHQGPTVGEIGTGLAKNLATGAASVVSDKVDLALSVGSALTSLGHGEAGAVDDTDLGVVASTAAGAFVDAAVASQPAGIVTSAVLDVALGGAGDDEPEKDVLAPPDPAAEPRPRGPR
jgi:hypothetical protein